MDSRRIASTCLSPRLGLWKKRFINPLPVRRPFISRREPPQKTFSLSVKNYRRPCPPRRSMSPVKPNHFLVTAPLSERPDSKTILSSWPDPALSDSPHPLKPPDLPDPPPPPLLMTGGESLARSTIIPLIKSIFPFVITAKSRATPECLFSGRIDGGHFGDDPPTDRHIPPPTF